MSGICVLVNLDGRPADPEVVRAMAMGAAYRGPDGINCWAEGAAGLAHLALHATPESVLEHQPLLGHNQNLCLVADVRIDNRDELMHALAGAAALPKTPTDPDLILAAYERWGEEAPRRILGDFAFAIWDVRRERLFCARDATGVKPLHYSRQGSVLCVASEAQQILQHPAIPRILDAIAVADYLVNRCDDEERTIFHGVRQVPPACMLIADRSGVRLQRYWSIAPENRVLYGRHEDYAEDLLERLGSAVTARLRTEGRTIGILMSGGLDSTSVAALAQRAIQGGEHRLIAYSYSFKALPECDERRYSEAMAQERGIQIEYVDSDRCWLLNDPEAFRPLRETPFLGWESHHRHILGRLRAEGGHVLLTGHAGPYSRLSHRSLVYLDALLHGKLGAVRQLIGDAQRQGVPALRAVLTWLVRPLVPPALLRLRSGRAESFDGVCPSWLRRDFVRRTGVAERLSCASTSRSVWGKRCRWSRHSGQSRRGAVGRAVYSYDRACARFGVEARHPLLDRRVVEFFNGVPPEEVFALGGDRLVFRRAMSGLLPEIVRHRQEKTSFLPFMDRSLRDVASKRVRSLLERPILAEMGIVDGPELLSTFEAYCSGQIASEEGVALWFPITLEMWIREYSGIPPLPHASSLRFGDESKAAGAGGPAYRQIADLALTGHGR